MTILQTRRVAQHLVAFYSLMTAFAAGAQSFEIIRAPSLPLELMLEQTANLQLVVRNTGDSIHLQGPSQAGAKNLTMTVKEADKALKRDPSRQIYPFDIDITRSDTGIISTDDERALTVMRIKMAEDTTVFETGRDTKIDIKVQNREPSKEVRTKSLSMFLRFYDGQCAYKLNKDTMRERPYDPLSKHASCITFSLPVVTQNVRFLATPEDHFGERDANGIPSTPPERQIKEGGFSLRDLPLFPTPDDLDRLDNVHE